MTMSNFRFIGDHQCNGILDLFSDPSNQLDRYCGRRQTSRGRTGGLVVGGSLAEDGEVPWMASLVFTGRHHCGGVIIDQQHVVTAAHCIIMRVGLTDDAAHCFVC